MNLGRLPGKKRGQQKGSNTLDCISLVTTSYSNEISILNNGSNYTLPYGTSDSSSLSLSLSSDGAASPMKLRL
jgi:hypothetical protein